MPSLRAFQAGLGNFRSALLPVPEEVAAQMDPRTIEMLRRQAILQMGLGMMGAGEKGAGLGTGASYGLQQAQDVMGRGLGQAWAANRAGREDRRLEIMDERSQKAEQRAMSREEQAAQRWQAERLYQMDRDTVRDKQWQEQFEAARSASNRAAAAAERADSREARISALAEQQRIDNATRIEVGKRIAELRQKGTPETDPKLQGMLTYYQTLAGSASLAAPKVDPWAGLGLGTTAPPLDDLYR